MKKNERIYHYTISICNCINDLIIKNETISINKISEHTNLDNGLIKKILNEYIKYDMYYNSYHILKNMINKINIYIDNKTIDLKKGFKSYKTIDMKYQTILENLNISYSNFNYLKSMYKTESIVIDLDTKLELLKNKPLYFCVDCNKELNKVSFFKHSCPYCKLKKFDSQYNKIINPLFIFLNNIKKEYETTGFLQLSRKSNLSLDNKDGINLKKILNVLNYECDNEFILYLKHKDCQIIKKCLEIIEYLKTAYLYKCLNCQQEISSVEHNKNLCFHCIKKENNYENVFIECSNCNEKKSLLEYPKSKNINIIGFKVMICKRCDVILFKELRRKNALEYSHTEHGQNKRKDYYNKKKK